VVDPSTLGEGGGEGNPNLPNAAEVLKQELINVGTQIVAGAGAQIGRAYAKTGDMGSALGAYGDQKFTNYFVPPKDGLTANVRISPLSDNAKLADFDKTISDNKITLEDIGNQDAINTKKSAIRDASVERTALLETGDTGIISGMKDRSGFVTDGNKMSAAGRANVFGSLGAGATTVAANLIAGKNLKESVKSGIKVGAGSYIGGLLFPGVGNFIGGLVGGRVICNELMRQGIMTRKQVALDYRFTRDYLTPTHVNGYHVWAVWMVRQMRKDRFVPFWKHVAGHRANEIAYIYGERAKPDYLGKAYRKILEPICWSIGFFCKKTDWTVLYKQKEV